VGFWYYEVASGTTTWSPGLRRIFGVDASFEPTYDSWLALVHPDDRDLVGATITEAIQKGDDYGFDNRLLRASDGALRWCRCRGRVTDGMIFGINIDVTAEHSAADTLREFIANAAHELRTPAAAIGHAVTALRTISGPEREQVMDVLERQANRLRTLTTNLVDLVIVDDGPSAALLEPVDVATAVSSAAAHAASGDARPIDVTGVPAGLRVVADAVALDRVLVNLLTNAWRYGGPNVVVDATAAPGGRVEIRVADDGEGVAADLVPALFLPFRRGDRRHPEASGLGLAMVDRLVRAMGGEVRHEAPPGGGAAFVVTLDGGG
jgi:signal transduction histidine kinase